VKQFVEEPRWRCDASARLVLVATRSRPRLLPAVARFRGNLRRLERQVVVSSRTARCSSRSSLGDPVGRRKRHDVSDVKADSEGSRRSVAVGVVIELAFGTDEGSWILRSRQKPRQLAQAIATDDSEGSAADVRSFARCSAHAVRLARHARDADIFRDAVTWTLGPRGRRGAERAARRNRVGAACSVSSLVGAGLRRLSSTSRPRSYLSQIGPSRRKHGSGMSYSTRCFEKAKAEKGHTRCRCS